VGWQSLQGPETSGKIFLEYLFSKISVVITAVLLWGTTTEILQRGCKVTKHGTGTADSLKSGENLRSSNIHDVDYDQI